MDTFFVRTFGCQMNKHDSERIAGLLAAEGLLPVDLPEEASVVVFNTCCVREKAEERFRGQVASLKALKDVDPRMVIAVGGCVAQRDGEAIVRDMPHIDVVFGTHNIHELPSLISRAANGAGASVALLEEGTIFASDLPSKRDEPWRAWVPITVGCDNHCTYCIVPSVRGAERSRRFDDVISEVAGLAEEGVAEITLLGQNVNSYGRDLYGKPRFAALLAAVAESGVPRIRFTTSHPKDLTDETIEVMASSNAICASLHLPVQSGSSDVLRRMGRCYTQEDYLALVDSLYSAMPNLSLSTDIMVGFPGETDEDFEDTMRVVEHSEYDQAFTFIFSPRKGTPAATMPSQVPREVSQVRFDRLVDAIGASALAKNRLLVGTVQRILVEGASKRDSGLLVGRTEGNKVVHAPFPANADCHRMNGRFFEVEIAEASTWFLGGRLRGYDT